MKFSEKLKTFRGQRDLSQTELAQAAGMTANKIQRFEQTDQKPKANDLFALARTFGVTADYLLDDALPYPPPEEHLSEKVVIIRKLEGLIGALLSHDADGLPAAPPAERPDVLRLPVFKLGAGFDILFDAAGQPAGEKVRDTYFDDLGSGRFFAAELLGSSMRGPLETGFALGEMVVFKIVPLDEIASGDYVLIRTADQTFFRQAFIHGAQICLRALNPADPEVVISRADVQHACRLVRRVRDY